MKKNTLKKVFFIFLSLVIVFIPLIKTQAEEIKTDDLTKVIFFTSPTCPHCSAEKEFFKEIKKDYPTLIIEEYDFSKNIGLATSLYQEYQTPKNQQGLVPATFIDGDFFVGFNDSIGQDIINKIDGEMFDKKEKNIKIPFFGEVNIYKLSLPVLAIILGIVDGFNVCSLGALVIILGLVMVLGSRKRIMFLGGTFVLITGATYGLLIFMWHQFFSVISPYIKSMELLIGIISIIGGIYLLREFVKALKGGASCSSGGIVAKLSPKVEKIFAKKKNIVLLVGVVILFAGAVTIIEFPCSAFLPVLFASILVEANLSMPVTFSYLALFILFYLLDEVIIFLIAFFTMKIKIVSPKFINIFNLIAALIFLFLGSYYLYRIFI